MKRVGKLSLDDLCAGEKIFAIRDFLGILYVIKGKIVTIETATGVETITMDLMDVISCEEGEMLNLVYKKGEELSYVNSKGVKVESIWELDSISETLKLI